MYKILFSIMASSSLLLLSTVLVAGTPDVSVTKADPAQKQLTKEPAQWGYEGEGKPQHWGELSPAFKRCSTGKNQSPINIKQAIKAELPLIKFKYNMLSANEIINTGYSIEVTMWSGGEIVVDDEKFKLSAFHFHTPSEHTIDGKSFPLEIHFTHYNRKKEWVVVSILFEPSNKDDELLTALWPHLPLNVGERQKLGSNVLSSLEFEGKVGNYYRFNGSLTTPPCSEGVRWIVMKSLRKVTQETILKLQKAIKHPNNRPVQPLNARVLLK